MVVQLKFKVAGSSNCFPPCGGPVFDDPFFGGVVYAKALLIVEFKGSALIGQARLIGPGLK